MTEAADGLLMGVNASSCCVDDADVGVVVEDDDVGSEEVQSSVG